MPTRRSHKAAPVPRPTIRPRLASMGLQQVKSRMLGNLQREAMAEKKMKTAATVCSRAQTLGTVRHDTSWSYRVVSTAIKPTQLPATIRGFANKISPSVAAGAGDQGRQKLSLDDFSIGRHVREHCKSCSRKSQVACVLAVDAFRPEPLAGRGRGLPERGGWNHPTVRMTTLFQPILYRHSDADHPPPMPSLNRYSLRQSSLKVDTTLCFMANRTVNCSSHHD